MLGMPDVRISTTVNQLTGDEAESVTVLTNDGFITTVASKCSLKCPFQTCMTALFLFHYNHSTTIHKLLIPRTRIYSHLNQNTLFLFEYDLIHVSISLEPLEDDSTTIISGIAIEDVSVNDNFSAVTQDYASDVEPVFTGSNHAVPDHSSPGHVTSGYMTPDHVAIGHLPEHIHAEEIHRHPLLNGTITDPGHVIGPGHAGHLASGTDFQQGLHVKPVARGQHYNEIVGHPGTHYIKLFISIIVPFKVSLII